MKMSRLFCFLCAGMLALGSLSACASGKSTSTAASTTADVSSAATSAITTSAAAATTTPPIEERVTLSMTSTDAGIAIPSDVDTSDNPFVNIAKDYANCEIVYEIIPWADYQTKCNLLLASGKYPDILHTAYNENISDVEDRGAFINLLPYFENSPVVQNRIDYETYLERMKNAKTGEYYAIPMGTQGDGYPDGYWFRARYDLLETYNNGEWPATIDGWIDVARKVREGNPNATPFSAWCPGTMIFQYNKQWWYAYGVESNLDIVQQDDGTFIFNVENPAYQAAMDLHRRLYEEGLLSQTFATNTDYAMMQNDHDNNDLLVWSDSVQQMSGILSSMEKTPDVKWVCAPLLDEYPVSLEDAMKKNTKFSAFDSGHRVHISKTCEHPDVAWRFIEGLCSEELYELIYWGEEGVTYKVVNDERVIDETTLEAYKDEHRTYGTVYGMIDGYGQGRLASLAVLKMTVDPNIIDLHLANSDIVSAGAIRLPYYSLDDLLSDDVSAKRDEAQGVMTSLAVKYIMGRISMEEYDAGITEFLNTYRFMTDEYNEAYKTRYGSAQ